MLLDNEDTDRVRMPLINGCNTDEAEIAARVHFLLPWKGSVGFRGVDLLPYHKMGVKKYEQLDMPYSFDNRAQVGEETLERIREQFDKAGIPVAIIRH